MSDFRGAVESGNLTDALDLLADDVVFTSPIVFAPYQGKPITAAILRAVFEVFEDFHYVREIVSPTGRDEALVFKAKVGALEINGCDLLHLDEDGRIDELMVMVRPLSAAQALAQAMGARFEQIRSSAAGPS